MNFIKFYIGDYLRDTGTLTLAQHGAYMLMLLEHYATERPLPIGRELHRLLRADSKAERDAVDFIAAKFWREQDGGLVNARSVKEFARTNDVSETNRAIALAREAKKRARTEHEQSTKRAQSVPRTEHESSTNQTTRHQTNTSEAIASGAAAPKPKPDEIIFSYGVPLLTASGSTEKTARSFLGGLRKAHGDGAVVNALRDCIRSKPLQPLEWLAKALPPASVGGAQTALERRNAAVAAELGAVNA